MTFVDHFRLSETDLVHWPQAKNLTPKLVNISENETHFLCDAACAPQFVLRVHRPGYQTEESIKSELAWLRALRDAHIHNIPEPIAGGQGQFLQVLRHNIPDGAAQHDHPKETRHAVLFRYFPGQELAIEQDLQSQFQKLGSLAAQCHVQSQNWNLPARFERPSIMPDSHLGTAGLWGDWRKAPNLLEQDKEIIAKAEQRLTEELTAYGQSRSNFGLIHADMRLANILQHEEQIRLIDFDDCGFSWHTYDFAAAISFYEHLPEISQLLTSWLSGYEPVKSLAEADISSLQPMIMFRRLMLLAWIGSRPETALAKSLAPSFAAQSAMLARKFVDTGNVVEL